MTLTRVTAVTQVLGGGTGRQLRTMYGSSPFTRWERSIVVLEEGTEPPPEGVRLSRLSGNASFGVYPLAQLGMFRDLWSTVNRLQPDVLHAYSFWPVLYGRLLKAAGVVDHLVENREDEGFDWGKHEYGFLRLTCRMPDAVVCVSESVRQVVLERERLPPRLTRVIHNGVRKPRLVTSLEVDRIRSDLGLSAEHRIVGMVANLNRPVKGGEYLIRAAPRILEAVPETRFLVVGGVRDASVYRTRVEALGLGEVFFFTGFQADVAPYYEVMDVSVLTSLSEGLSMTLLESMSHGLPVVATDVGGNPEIVADGSTGFLVPPADPHSFADRVLDLLRDPTLRERMAAAARRRYELNFTLERAARSYAALFEEIAGSA